MLTTDNEELLVDSPSKFPESSMVKSCQELWAEATIIAPGTYMPAIAKLCMDHRGEQKDMQ